MTGGAFSGERPLTRGQVAARTGCNIETVRYYERIGLLPSPPRSAGGHRLYGADLVKRLVFIRRSRELGFALEEVRDLLDLVDAKGYTCAEIETITRDHLQTVRAKIADLRKIEAVLEDMVSQCEGGTTPRCPVVDALFREGKSPCARSID